MGYQTRALPGSGTWMMESGIRNRITEWYLFVEKKKIQILQKFSMFRKEADLGKTVKIVGKQKMAVLAERIMDTYGNAVLRLAYTYVHNMSDAEDIPVSYTHLDVYKRQSPLATE